MELSNRYHSIIPNITEYFLFQILHWYQSNFYKLLPTHKWMIQHIPNVSSSFYSIAMLRKTEDSFMWSFIVNLCQSPLGSSKMEGKMVVLEVCTNQGQY